MMNKLKFIKIKDFCFVKDTGKIAKEITNCENIFEKDLSNKRKLSKICKTYVKLKWEKKSRKRSKEMARRRKTPLVSKMDHIPS